MGLPYRLRSSKRNHQTSTRTCEASHSPVACKDSSPQKLNNQKYFPDIRWTHPKISHGHHKLPDNSIHTFPYVHSRTSVGAPSFSTAFLGGVMCPNKYTINGSCTALETSPGFLSKQPSNCFLFFVGGRIFNSKSRTLIVDSVHNTPNPPENFIEPNPI